jgi:hypothetical protein
VLFKIADGCDDEVDNAVSAMTSLLEPLLIIFLAVVVGSRCAQPHFDLRVPHSAFRVCQSVSVELGTRGRRRRSRWGGRIRRAVCPRARRCARRSNPK